MVNHLAERVVHELVLIRMTLDGGVEADKLSPVPVGTDEAEHRRLVTLALIDRLKDRLTDVGNVAEDTAWTLYEMVEGWEIAHQFPPEVEEKVFGFAAGRKAM
jgi:hypothetical protein